MGRIVLWLIVGFLALPAWGVAAQPLSPQERAVIPFEGTLDLKDKVLSLDLGRLPEGALGLRLARVAPGHFELHADIRHVMTPLCDLAAELEGKFEITGTEYARRELQGEVSTHYTLLNYKPVRDLFFKFTVRNRRLTIDPFWFGVVSGRGTVELMGAHGVNAGVEVVSTDLEDVWEIMRARGMKPPPLSGIVTGALSFEGPASQLSWSGQVSAYNGRLKHFDYEQIDLRFDGKYPALRLHDGSVISAQGPRFKVEGVLDLGDMERMPTQLRQLKRDFVISNDGSGRAWTVGRLSDRPEHLTQLKSFVSGKLDGRGEGEGVIGVQKKIGF